MQIAGVISSRFFSRFVPPLACINSAPLHFSTTVQHLQSTMQSKKAKLADRLKGTEKNVWVEYIALAREHGAISLGQGFPDFHAPLYVRQALAEAVTADDQPLLNQYTRGYGHPRLVNILSKFFEPIHGQSINPMTEVLVTAGAYESLYCCFQGLVNPGDEVIIIEPFFDCYGAMAKTAGATAKFVPLRPKTGMGDKKEISSADWVLDEDELEKAFSPKTKALVFNTPNNPLGKVYSRAETQMIADKCKKHDVLVFSDEVYEWLVYKGEEHVRIATLPDMWDRTITIRSAGKTFSVTGWKLGWSIAPQHLMQHLHVAHQNCVYTCPTPIQEAVARGFEIEISRLGKPECYFMQLPMELEPKRNMMANFLKDVGMVPTVPQGGYFMIADFSNIDVPFDEKSSDTKDAQFVKWLTREKKLAAIPPSAFYCDEHAYLAKDLVRFCFIKEDSTLENAAKIIKEWKANL